MKNVLIRDLDDRLVERFKREAKRRGTSLQAVLKQTLNDNQPEAINGSFWDRLESARKESGPATAITRDLIQEGRDTLAAKTSGYPS